MLQSRLSDTIFHILGEIAWSSNNILVCTTGIAELLASLGFHINPVAVIIKMSIWHVLLSCFPFHSLKPC